MTKHTARLSALALFLVAPSALAQAPATPETAAPAAPAESAPAPVPAPTPAAQPDDTAKKLAALEAKVAAMEEANKANQAAIAASSKLKFSGYVQGRYEWHQDATNGITYSTDGKATPTVTNTDRFLVRHGYLTANYKGTNAEYFFQIDANSKDGIAMKDVYATFVDTWTPLNLRLSAGQFRYPFGYEAQQSDADREMPERAPIEKFFFDGERDRGLRLQGAYKFFNFQVALVNGTVFDGKKNQGANKDPVPFGSADPNEFKDWVGRLGVDFGTIVGGVSGYFGKGLYIKPGTTNTSDPSLSTPDKADSRYKYRVGADLQTYLDVPSVGLLAVKGEVIYGKDTGRAYRGVDPDPCTSSATWGFIGTIVQNLPMNLGLVVRVDMKDTLAGSISNAAACTATKPAGAKTLAESDRVITTGAGLLYYASPNLKLTATYEHPTEQGANKADNDFAMAQMQARF